MIVENVCGNDFGQFQENRKRISRPKTNPFKVVKASYCCYRILYSSHKMV